MRVLSSSLSCATLVAAPLFSAPLPASAALPVGSRAEGPDAAAVVVTSSAPGEDPRIIAAAVVVPEPVVLGRIKGRHRLHFDANVFSWRRVTPWDDHGLARSKATDAIDLIGGAPVLGSAGLAPPGSFGLGWGKGVSDKVVLGLRVGLGFHHASTPAADRAAAAQLAYWVTPYFEYVGRSGHRVRPYFGVRVGVAGSLAADLRPAVGTARRSTVGPTLGASLGLHAFLTERVSLDPAVTFDYGLVWGRDVSEPLRGGERPPPFDKRAMVPNLAAVLSLSVWLGGGVRDRRR